MISAVRYEAFGRARKGVASNLRRRAAQERRPRARQAQAQQAFRAARARQGHHHGRPRHRRRAVPRLRAGAPRHRGHRQKLAVLRRPLLHPRLPLPARLAGGAHGRFAHPHGRRLLARHAAEGLRAAQDVGAAPRSGRLARQRRAFLRLRRCQGDGEGRARDAGARLCRRESSLRRRPPSRRWRRSSATSAICRTRIESCAHRDVAAKMHR